MPIAPTPEYNGEKDGSTTTTTGDEGTVKWKVVGGRWIRLGLVNTDNHRPGPKGGRLFGGDSWAVRPSGNRGHGSA